MIAQSLNIPHLFEDPKFTHLQKIQRLGERAIKVATKLSEIEASEERRLRRTNFVVRKGGDSLSKSLANSTFSLKRSSPINVLIILMLE